MRTGNRKTIGYFSVLKSVEIEEYNYMGEKGWYVMVGGSLYEDVPTIEEAKRKARWWMDKLAKEYSEDCYKKIKK